MNVIAVYGHLARAAVLAAICLGATFVGGTAQAAAALSVLYSPPLQDGPIAGAVIVNGDGLIGTVDDDGCCGAVFYYNLTLHQFGIGHVFTGASDGAGPNLLKLDASGTIHGTTGAGGAHNWGTVFSISAGGTFQKLYDFTNGTDGAGPVGQLAEDEAGRLYGVTGYGGPGNAGTIFRFDPATNSLVTLYGFRGNGDGSQPVGSLVWDARGDLLGAASFGGKLSACDEGCGTVFRYSPVNGQFKVLHVFTGGRDGAVPMAGLTAGGGGLFYGTTTRLGARAGGIFAIDAQSGHFVPLHAFSAALKTGHVVASLALGGDGALYGAAPWGGAHGEGEIFRFDPATGFYSALYDFNGETSGAAPAAGLAFGADGTLYGATYTYGASDEGTLFQLTVPALTGRYRR